ncbi:MAG TPA: Hsp70 family protein [Anaerolineae bacterium]|nr:Hsp70 family protein [Anaerolineae bacterium]HQK14449.1 Hsp70 family protein [Anaerolineae bacterium]
MPFGIDLGTTTTLVARAHQGKDPETIEAEILKVQQPGENGQELNHLPSVAYIPETGSPIVGKWAKENGHHKNAARCIRAVKRLMGRELFLPVIEQTPAQISALYLEEVLRQIVERGFPLDELTVTVPASYTTNQRRDTLHAVDLALDALKLPRLGQAQRERLLISEPVAALLAFIAWDMQRARHARRLEIPPDASTRVLVYDIGGGTLDLTIVELSWRDPHGAGILNNLQFKVIEISRHNQFGGEDFDLRLAREFLYRQLLAQFPALENLELSDAERLALRYDLVNEAERLKIALNAELEFDEESVYFNVKPLVIRGQEYPFSIELTESDYEDLMGPYLQYHQTAKNALYPITEILDKAQMAKADIHYFLPVGGMVRLLPLQKALQAYWGQEATFLAFPVPDEAIGQGAAVYSYLKTVNSDFRIDEPAADAYYVCLTQGFDLLLERKERINQYRTYHLDKKGDKLLLQLFAGDDPPSREDLWPIYHTLIYQGGVAIPLDKEYEAGTPVQIQIERRADTKVPVVRLQIGEPPKFVREIDFEDLKNTHKEIRYA